MCHESEPPVGMKQILIFKHGRPDSAAPGFSSVLPVRTRFVTHGIPLGACSSLRFAASMTSVPKPSNGHSSCFFIQYIYRVGLCGVTFPVNHPYFLPPLCVRVRPNGVSCRIRSSCLARPPPRYGTPPDRKVGPTFSALVSLASSFKELKLAWFSLSS